MAHIQQLPLDDELEFLIFDGQIDLYARISATTMLLYDTRQ